MWDFILAEKQSLYRKYTKLKKEAKQKNKKREWKKDPSRNTRKEYRSNYID